MPCTHFFKISRANIDAAVFPDILQKQFEMKISSILKRWCAHVFYIRNTTCKRTYGILAQQNKIVIYRYCVILSNAFAIFACVSNRRGVQHTRAFDAYGLR